ncbi:hypothetical protein M409DRAFT_54382 [Zasmidium cellare ATCC 36951]|uniref:Zn(2)-C6 fungal-type domain-containing protein n=1 Tax=Zasmidium cellare ATCC 36951 TaxID=1080233 RepID=A0A6A6CIY8_ZASCE|nr:uncharacterized protein M409DRAFT_54382 [Zasmidium cellare ATCC 36951]KAF2167194.1 hypothetical protein M409DRAFT_54382 [Zasmidium cellare ATCC 36951]
MKMEQGDDPSQTIAVSTSATSGSKGAVPHDSSATRKTKSRYGCRGCKSRRLKCDETHPACLQCLRRGRECPGYARDFKFSDKHEKLRFAGNETSRKRKRNGSADFQEVTSTETTKSSSQARHSVQPKGLTPKLEQQEPQDPIDVLPFGSKEPDVDVMKLIFPESPLESPQRSPSNGPFDSIETKTSPAVDPAANEAHERTADVSQPAANTHNPDEELVVEECLEEIATEVTRMPNLPSNRQKRRASNQLIQRAKSRIPNTPVDLPSTLIEYWFTHVCGMWSAYDSESNPNRQLALNTCFNSESVFYALQSMSAACLVDSLPHLKPVLASTSGNALAAINRDMAMYYDLNAPLDGGLPTDLLLAIFAMATSLCWTDTKQLGEPLVIGARTVLIRFQDTGGGLDDKSRKELLHFHHALKYTEMLLNFVSSESAFKDLEIMRQKHRTRLRHVMRWDGDQDSIEEEPAVGTTAFGPQKDDDHDATIHPWTGVSRKVQEQFGLVMALCRDHHTRRVCTGVHNANALCESLCDIEVARELAQHLMQSNFASDIEDSDMPAPALQTGDNSTPVTHLLDTAEAYRLAALLQLYITFPDLEVRLDDASPSQEPPFMEDNGELERSQALTTLTLLLVDVLERIPPESGTRCIQPVLYVSAATGLRFDTPVVADPEVFPLTQCTIEVSRARKFIVDRLSTLLRSLPPRPIGVALNLIKAIWSEYDYGQNAATGGHWMDVMMKTGLHTLFG